MKIIRSEAIAFLKEHDNYLILSHQYPDGDTLGSAFALCRLLRRLGKKANVECNDPIPPRFSYLHADLPKQSFEPECVTAVDVADTKLLGSRLNKLYGDKIQLCIDHHGSNLEYAEKLLLDANAGAVGEMIFEIYRDIGVPLDKPAAEALYTAIATDTGCFKYSNTTPKTLRISAELMELGVNVEGINRLMFDLNSKARLALQVMILDSLRYDLNGRCASIFITKEMLERTGATDDEIEGFSSLPRTIEGVDCGITFRESDDGFKISVRTTSALNACEICRSLGGGGHPAAAGCRADSPLEAAYQQVIAAVKKFL
ncbi:MAG: DHH family phosphoesterase [Oscillospiraceae bacterium]|nr:DHH family phosphoesterase [Oscillospiraceae bacterium]